MSKPHIPILSSTYAHALHRDDFIAHPDTGRQSYGYVPEMESRGITLPAGHIFLRAGRHFGPNRGYGVNHIWDEHCHELPRLGCKSIDQVASYVAAVIVHKAPIYCEFKPSPKGYRVAILRSSKGYAILEPVLNDDQDIQFYSVVTVYKLKRNAQGTLVGQVNCNV